MKFRISRAQRSDFVERRAFPRPPRFIARIPTGTKIWAAFAIALMILVFVGLSVRHAHQQLRDAVAVQIRTHDVLRGVGRMAISAGRAEAAHRRYIARGEDPDVQEFEQAVGELQEELARLGEAFSDGADSGNAQRVAALRTIADERIGDMQAANELRQQGRVDEAVAASAALAESPGRSGAGALMLAVGAQELAVLGQEPVEIERRVARLSAVNQGAIVLSALLLLVALWVITQDLRERRRIERALRDSEAWLKGYEQIFDASPDGVLVLDHDGILRDVNPAAMSMFGYGPEELIGECVEVLVAEDSLEAYRGYRDDFLGSPRPLAGVELYGRRKSGASIVVEIGVSPLEREGDSPLVVATVRNITQRRRLREFSASGMRATEEERQRIARELHDDTAQRLASALIRVRLLEQAPWNEQQTHIKALHEELSETAESVLQLARGLRPPGIERSDLDSILRTHARRLEDSSGFVVEVDVEPVDDLLTPDQKLVIYRILQEGLTNVMRHANVSTAKITVCRTEGRVVASVEDSGRGFDVSEAEEREEGGLGLLGMRERAAMVGGILRIESSPSTGTRVELLLPVRDVVSRTDAGGDSRRRSLSLLS